jgi:hypothetical protein
MNHLRIFDFGLEITNAVLRSTPGHAVMRVPFVLWSRVETSLSYITMDEMDMLPSREEPVRWK